MNINKCYTILGIGRNSSLEFIKITYKKLCLKFDLDKCGGDQYKCIELTNAYDAILK